MLESGRPQDRAAWREGMKRLAARANVNVKLSGQGTFSHRVDPEFIAGVVADCVSLFGSERCMFGSNFPVEKIWTDFGSLWLAHSQALADLPAKDRENILRETATRVYRL
jgi:predicted TIM-barrel fold metal-dependent hydrolase